jgi:excisionase family DNA binding protein
MKLLSIKQTAAVLSLSRWTVSAMLETGALPGIVLKNGKRKKIWRVSEQALQKWVEAKEAETKKSIHSSSDRKLQAV